MRIQENLYLYKTFNIWEEILKNISKYEWKKDLLNSNIKINYSLKIPIDKLNNKNIYAIRLIPIFKSESKYIDIPSLLIECDDSNSNWIINYSNDNIKIKAKYNIEHPWYFVEEFLLSYKYLAKIISWFYIDVQFAEHLDFDPSKQKEKYVDEFWFCVFKDWIYNSEYKKWNKSYYEIFFDNIIITNIFSSFNRSPFISVRYPVYKEMTFTSIVVIPNKTENNTKFIVPWVTYEDNFYKNLWVPLNRSLYINLNFSWSFQNCSD